MLGLDVYRGSKAQVEGFSTTTGITFPMLLRADQVAGSPFSREDLIVVDSDGVVRFSQNSLGSSSVRNNAIAKVDELLAPPPSAPAISVQQTAVNFGTINAGQTGEQTITITNTGTASLEITGIESDVSGLTFDTTTFTLEPDGSQTVTVTFPSSTAGEFSGSIDILSNDPDRATQTLSVSGTVSAPVTPPPVPGPVTPPLVPGPVTPPPVPGPVDPPSVPVLAVQESAIDFGTVEVGQNVEKTFTIRNTGSAPLEITGIQSDVSGLTFSPAMFTLAPESSQTVTIMFPNPTAGAFSGSIDILSNDPDQAKHTLSISGIAQMLSEEVRSDFDGNGEINIVDFLLFVNAFGSSDPQYDIDGDGEVGISDFLIFVTHFGKKPN